VIRVSSVSLADQWNFTWLQPVVRKWCSTQMWCLPSTSQSCEDYSRIHYSSRIPTQENHMYSNMTHTMTKTIHYLIALDIHERYNGRSLQVTLKNLQILVRMYVSSTKTGQGSLWRRMQHGSPKRWYRNHNTEELDLNFNLHVFRQETGRQSPLNWNVSKHSSNVTSSYTLCACSFKSVTPVHKYLIFAISWIIFPCLCSSLQLSVPLIIE
jgi:hypothetical protein